MSDDVPVTEVFEDVDADPDAVITAYGATDVDDLLAGSGSHDLEPHGDGDGPVDCDVEAAAERLSRLADVALDPSADAVTPDDLDALASASNGGEPDEPSASGLRYDVESVGGGPTVDVLPADGESFESFLGLDESAASAISNRRGHALVGPEPETSRISNDSFGPVRAGGSWRNTGARTPTRASSGRPDPAAVDSAVVTDREFELAESVFEWVS